MFASKQIEALFDRIGNLEDSASSEGCEADLTVVDSVALHEVLKEVKRLKTLNQRLLFGRHEHRHGDSVYLFLVPQGIEFDKDDLESCLQEDFEPDMEEFLSVETMDEPTIITGTEEIEAIVAFINEHEEWWKDQLWQESLKDRGGVKKLNQWLRCAREAQTIQDAQHALMGFVSYVELGFLSWLEPDDDCTENILFENAAKAIGKSVEDIEAIKSRILSTK